MYKRIGRKIYDKKLGSSEWILKQVCENVINAKKALKAIGINSARKHAISGR